jgi:hypothetical protein
MRVKGFIWHLAPGFSVIACINAFRNHGVEAIKMYEEISTRPRKGWKPVRINLTVEREKPNADSGPEAPDVTGYAALPSPAPAPSVSLMDHDALQWQCQAWRMLTSQLADEVDCLRRGVGVTHQAGKDPLEVARRHLADPTKPAQGQQERRVAQRRTDDKTAMSLHLMRRMGLADRRRAQPQNAATQDKEPAIESRSDLDPAQTPAVAAPERFNKHETAWIDRKITENEPAQEPRTGLAGQEEAMRRAQTCIEHIERGARHNGMEPMAYADLVHDGTLYRLARALLREAGK